MHNTPAARPAASADLLLVLALLAGSLSVVCTSDDTVFTSGTVPTDTSGQPVYAQEGWLMSQGDSFLWYGAGQQRNVSYGDTWDWVSDSINLYTSHDLSSWKKRGTVFAAGDVPQAVRARLLQGSSGTSLRLERPKVLYNAARRYYVLMLHLDTLERSRGEVAWTTSVSPYGPFRFDAARQPSGLPSWDITVASQNEASAWLVQAVPGEGLAISPLASDYLDTEGVCARISPLPSTTAWHQHAAQLPLQHQHHHQHQQRRQQQQQQPQQPRKQQPAWYGSIGASSQPLWHSLMRVIAGPLPAFMRVARVLREAVVRSTTQGPGRGVAGAAAMSAAAPCLFTFSDKFYLLAVQKTGRKPSKPLLYVNKGSSPCDAAGWQPLPPPMLGIGAAGAPLYDSIPAFVYPYTYDGSDRVLLIYFGDRQGPTGSEGTSNSSYVYLPMLPAGDADGLQLQAVASWRPSDYRASLRLRDNRIL